MFARTALLSLAFSLLAQHGVALDLDTSNQDSIKSAAKTLAGGIIATYNRSLEATNVPGIFGEPYYWWQAGTTFNALLEYSRLTGDSQYDYLISEALIFQRGEHDDYLPANVTKDAGNEDQSTWALAALTAAENGFKKPQDGEWVDYAITVADQQATRFEMEQKGNDTCGGGLRWQIYSFNAGYMYKDASSNANFFLLAARLARFTGNQTYSQWAEASYTWAKDAGLITDEFAVYAGASTTNNCSEVDKLQWSNSVGTYTEGSAVMYNTTNGTQKWADAAAGFVNASSIFWSDNTKPSALVESACEEDGKCNIDMQTYKGIAARSFARAAQYVPAISKTVQEVLESSAKGAAAACDNKNGDVLCKASWTGKEDNSTERISGQESNLSQTFSALEVVQGLLYKNAPAAGTEDSPSPSPTQSGGSAPPQNSANAAHTMGASMMLAAAGAVVALLN